MNFSTFSGHLLFFILFAVQFWVWSLLKAVWWCIIATSYVIWCLVESCHIGKHTMHLIISYWIQYNIIDNVRVVSFFWWLAALICLSVKENTLTWLRYRIFCTIFSILMISQNPPKLWISIVCLLYSKLWYSWYIDVTHIMLWCGFWWKGHWPSTIKYILWFRAIKYFRVIMLL